MLLQITKNDLNKGMKKRILIYLLPALALSALCIAVSLKLHAWTVSGRITGTISLADMYMAFFQGSILADINGKNSFYMSEPYVLLSVGMAYIIGNYAVKDLYGIGMQYIIRCQNIKQWWFSKIIWCFLSCIVLYLVIFFTLLALCIWNGYSLCLTPNSSVLECLGYHRPLPDLQAMHFLVLCLLLPVFASFGLCMLQMTFSIILSPIISFLIVMAEMTACIYTSLSIFLSNGFMLIRNRLFYDGKTDTLHMLISSLCIIILSAVAGYFYLSQMDFLTKKEA